MNRCLGPWVLVPELCHYSAGAPPEAGTYEIGQIDGRFVFGISWTKDGQGHSTTFSAPDDGSPEETAIPGLTHVAVTAIDDGTIDSAAFAGDEVKAYARRRVSDDGGLLTVYMENAGPKGPEMIYQVYRKA
jgi:hypothetical protein